jgi:hypothetical protein
VISRPANRFDIYVGGDTLQCITDAAGFDSWVDFLKQETPIKLADKPPTAAADLTSPRGASQSPTAAAASATTNKAQERAVEKAAIAALIQDAVAREDFEVCVIYRQYKKVSDTMHALVRSICNSGLLTRLFAVFGRD